MKKLLLGLLFVACATCLIPAPGSCAGPFGETYVGPSAGRTYIAVKPGMYSPQSSDLNGFNTGFNGEIVAGYRCNPNVAVEMGLGYFHTDSTLRASGQVFGVLYSGSNNRTIDVFPLTLTFQGILPVGKWEFYGMGGVGGYFVSGEAKLSASAIAGSTGVSISDSVSDTDTVFGGFAGLGFHYNITPAWFIGAEGKYLWTTTAHLQDQLYGITISSNFKLDGILANAIVGFRF